MDSVVQDLRYTIRTLRRRPGFAALAVLTLAVGIGVNTVAFSAVNALLLKPFKIKDGDRVGWLLVGSRGNPHGNASLDEFNDLARNATAFSAIAAEGRLPVSLQSDAGADQAWALLISANYFGTIDATPEIGRLLSADDVRAGDLAAVVSHRFWTEKLGSGSIAGRSIVLNGRSFSVVGVLPADFQGPGGLYAPDVWLPLERIDVLNTAPALRTDEWLTMVGRIRSGVHRPEADAQLDGISLARSAGAEDARRRTIRFYPMSDGHPDLQAVSRIAWPAMAVVAAVLLLACFNVAALLMARSSERQREIGVRSALGASRGRILRQLATEGTVLAFLSGIATLVVAAWSGSLLSTFSLPAPIPQKLHLGIDRTLIAFTAALVFFAGVFPAVLPALHATRVSLLGSLRMESSLGGRPSRTRNTLVILQVAGSTLFLAAALLFVRSFVKSVAADPGFDIVHTLTVQLSPSLYGYDAGRARVMVDRLRDKLLAVPGVRAVGIGDRVPFYVGFPRSTEYSTGDACSGADCRRASVYLVDGSYFEALGIPIHEGRAFTDGDMRSSNAVVISQYLASQLWPGRPAVGRTFRVGKDQQTVEVIGVAANIRHRSMSEAEGAYLYRPLAGSQWSDSVTVIVRADNDPRALLGAVRDQARAIDNAMPLVVATMDERMKLPLWPVRTAAGFFVTCGVLALILATVGLFGVLYYTVTQRTREFGIRTALGATSRRLIAVVLGEGLSLAVPGVVLGGLAAYAAARFLARGLYGIVPGDPLSFSTTVVIELVVTLAAAAVPAYRATRSDPMLALRQE